MTTIRQRSSGDLLADRRYIYAEPLLAEVDAAAALAGAGFHARLAAARRLA